MARPSSETLTEAELRPMTVLWQRGRATVQDIVDALHSRHGLSYSTVLTTLRILERKGYVGHDKEGAAFVYHPLVDQASARQSALKQLMRRFFDDQPDLLLQNLLETESVDAAELRRLQALIEAHQDDAAPSRS
ncbi:MAG: BlaI/MecI/CopY family transcriptional regulator [Verrucomicrobia bacterium]|nr:BlaI/MecI/CopY family transcriptional regulator [Verrucomicrobiota bacterium]